MLLDESIVNSREIIARIRELELQENKNKEEYCELLQLITLQDRVTDYVNYFDTWQDGINLMHDDYIDLHCKSIIENEVKGKNLSDYIIIDWDESIDRLKNKFYIVSSYSNIFYIEK